jgi:phage tail protein X
MTTYVTREGDTADLIAFKYYGTTDARVVERMLEVNTGLADIGPILPAGISITLPEIDTTEKIQGVRLWD